MRVSRKCFLVRFEKFFKLQLYLNCDSAVSESTKCRVCMLACICVLYVLCVLASVACFTSSRAWHTYVFGVLLKMVHLPCFIK